MFLYIDPYSSTLEVAKSRTLSIKAVDLKDTGSLVLPLISVLPQKLLNQTWLVNGAPNGNETFGTISGSGASRMFTAPSKIPEQDNPALIKVRFNGPFTTKLKTYKNLELKAKIEITDERKFLFKLWYNYDVLGTGQIYWDSVRLNVTKNNDNSVTIDNIQNFTPKETPKSIVQGECTITWVPKNLGLLNITGGDGYIPYNGRQPSADTLAVNLLNNAIDPVFTVICTTGYTNTLSGGPNMPSYHIFFNMQNWITVKSLGDNWLNYRVTRLK